MTAIFLSGADEVALRYMDRFVERIPSAAPMLHYPRGHCCARLGKHDRAYGEFVAALNEGDNVFDAAYALGRYDLERQDYQQALEPFDTALRDHDAEAQNGRSRAAAMVGRAQALGGLRRRREAIAACEDAASSAPEHHDPWFYKALYLDEEGDRRGAIMAYSEAIARNPNSRSRWFNRACEHALLGRKEDALADLARAAELKASYLQSAREDSYFAGLLERSGFPSMTESV